MNPPGASRPHPLAGQFSVAASARRIRHYRYVEERMMRMLGGWIALTPELSAKLLLGRHVWDCAQHADLWGRRLPELRAPAHESEPPSGAFAQFLDALENREGHAETAERLAGVYRVLKPHLLATYEAHLAIANAVYEPPTRRILERCIGEERRHIAAGEAVLRHHVETSGVRSRIEAWEHWLGSRLADSGGLSGDGSIPSVTPLAPAAEAQELARQLIAFDQPVGHWPIPEALESALAAHRAAIRAHDLVKLESQVAMAARPRVLPLYWQLDRMAQAAVSVVGCARIGRHWAIKLRGTVDGGSAVLLTRWADDSGAWQITDAEVVSRDGVFAE
jgi:hypothetical protein